MTALRGFWGLIPFTEDTGTCPEQPVPVKGVCQRSGDVVSRKCLIALTRYLQRQRTLVTLTSVRRKLKASLCVFPPGAGYDDSTAGHEKEDDAVYPGGYYEYVWDISPKDGPTSSDPECLTYSYSSQVDPVRDINSGLIGALLICKTSQSVCVCVCWGGLSHLTVIYGCFQLSSEVV